jgi:hypothetical protein
MLPDEALRQLAEALPGLAAGSALTSSRLSVSTLENPERPILIDIGGAGASRVVAPGQGDAQRAAFDCLHSLLLAESPSYAQWYFATVAQRLLAAAAERGNESDCSDALQRRDESSDDGNGNGGGGGGGGSGDGKDSEDVDEVREA